MEELNKTQLILLALLVSFITSIATGIVTVTLMDQAPPAVTQTINRVVERTVEVVAPDAQEPRTITQTVVVKEEDFVVEAAKKNSDNVIALGLLKRKGFTLGTIGEPVGKDQTFEKHTTGVIVSADGLIVAPGAPREEAGALVVQTLERGLFEAHILARDDTRGLVLARVERAIAEEQEEETVGERAESVRFAQVEFGDSNTVQIGQTAIALGIDNGLLLLLGVISRLETVTGEEGKEVVKIYTTTDLDEKYSGGPLLGTDGKILGMNIVSGSESLTIPARVIQTFVAKNK